jgi:type IV fimbrial biogenesis protein FimT
MRNHSPAIADKTRGVTLIELIIAVAVLAILITVAAPSFREISLRNRATSIANSLLADLALARNEAVKTARMGYVSSRGNWRSGWIVWVDANGNGSRDDDEPILRQQDAVEDEDADASNQFTVQTLSGFSGGGSVSAIGFAPLGQLRVPDDGARIGICRPDRDEEKSLGIRIDLSGRAQSIRNLRAMDMGCA